jgi:ElaB/YqjD/DUF883 family membrane-anchored ribosome-binding protein
MDTGNTTGVKSPAQQAQEMTDNAANTTQGAIRSTQRAADQALDRLSDTVEGVRSKAGPMLNKVASQAQAAAQDMTVAYVKDEPIKAMLIAAATGALLMGLITLISRSRD